MAITSAVILIMVGSGLDFKTCGGENANFPNLNLNNFFLGLGSFLFAYGGHGAFPTIQHDMKKPSEFTKSAILAFICEFLVVLGIVVKKRTKLRFFLFETFLFVCRMHP